MSSLAAGGLFLLFFAAKVQTKNQFNASYMKIKVNPIDQRDITLASELEARLIAIPKGIVNCKVDARFIERDEEHGITFAPFDWYSYGGKGLRPTGHGTAALLLTAGGNLFTSVGAESPSTLAEAAETEPTDWQREDGRPVLALLKATDADGKTAITSLI